MIFRSFKTNASVYDAKLGHGPHSLPPGVAASPKRLEKVAYPQFGLRTQTANQAKLIPPKTSPVPSTRYSLARTFMTCMISKSLA